MFRIIATVTLATLAFIALQGCASAQGETPDEKRAATHQMADDTLARLYELRPDLRDHVNSAPGYAVFSNVGTKIFLLSSGNGYGIVHNNRTGEETYMRMNELGVGVGLGVKDFYAVFVFRDEQIMNQFVNSGWEWGGDADAAAKAGEDGAAAGVVASTNAGPIEIYQITESGVALSATVSGTKYWKSDLNNEG